MKTKIVACFIPLLIFSSTLSAEKRFVDRDTYESKVQEFDDVVHEQIQSLRKRGVDETDMLSIEISFATDQEEKARKLMIKLKEQGCEVSIKPRESTFSSQMLYFIKGRSQKLQMSDNEIKEWIKLAMQTAYNFDCEYSVSKIDGIIVGRRP
jgi:hypothetical protein